jgi:hypothetical protein
VIGDTNSSNIAVKPDIFVRGGESGVGGKASLCGLLRSQDNSGRSGNGSGNNSVHFYSTSLTLDVHLYNLTGNIEYVAFYLPNAIHRTASQSKRTEDEPLIFAPQTPGDFTCVCAIMCVFVRCVCVG